jgi:protein involved in polysaccharide export with SLBB domain
MITIIQRWTTRVVSVAILPMVCCFHGILSAQAASDQAPAKSANPATTNAVSSGRAPNASPGESNVMKVSATNLSAATNTAPVNETNHPSVVEGHKLSIGDRMSFKIVEEEDDSKPLIVTDDGDVEVPFIGRVPAENKTCKELTAEIKAALEKDYYYHATVVISIDSMSKTHGRVYLVGAVRAPGPVELPSDETLTLSKAILRAGGFTDYADRRHVKLTRKDADGKSDKQTFIVNVGEIFDDGKVESDRDLQSGDLVYIPDRLIRF